MENLHYQHARKKNDLIGLPKIVRAISASKDALPFKREMGTDRLAADVLASWFYKSAKTFNPYQWLAIHLVPSSSDVGNPQ